MEVLRTELKDLEIKEKILRQQIEDIERNCSHNWIDVREYHTSDLSSILNVVSFPAQTPTTFWQRTCSSCGKVEKTSKYKEKVERMPDFEFNTLKDIVRISNG